MMQHSNSMHKQSMSQTGKLKLIILRKSIGDSCLTLSCIPPVCADLLMHCWHGYHCLSAAAATWRPRQGGCFRLRSAAVAPLPADCSTTVTRTLPTIGTELHNMPTGYIIRYYPTVNVVAKAAGPQMCSCLSVLCLLRGMACVTGLCWACDIKQQALHFT